MVLSAMLTLNEFIEACILGLPPNIAKVIIPVAALAYDNFFYRYRRNGELLLSHSARVYEFIQPFNFGPEAESAALGHDLLEDGLHLTFRELEALLGSFGEYSTTFMIVMMTRVVRPGLDPIIDNRRIFDEYYDKLVWGTRRRPELPFIKVKDRFDGHNSPYGKSPEKELAYIAETEGEFSGMLWRCRSHTPFCLRDDLDLEVEKLLAKTKERRLALIEQIKYPLALSA